MSLADPNQGLSSLRCIPELRPQMQSISAKCAAGSRDSLARKIQDSLQARHSRRPGHAPENAEALHLPLLCVLAPALNPTATFISVPNTPRSSDGAGQSSGKFWAHIIEDLHPEKTH